MARSRFSRNGETLAYKSENTKIHAKSDSFGEDAAMQHVLSPMIDLMASKLRQELTQLLSGDDPPTTVSWYGSLVYIRTFAEINIII